MHAKQPGMVLKVKAKPGMGDELFKACHELHFNGDPDGPVEWVLARSDEDPDLMWAFEFYRDDASFDRHYSSAALQEGQLDEGHQRIADLVADGADEWGVRAPVHVVSAS
ncbi:MULTISPECIES: putative quinol monooxygenase [Amycolatopsis]|uniref:Quinol monooxygenase YgiN n=2 Tax=Amycolatopsis TaxID=1813 RepID=A0A1I4BQ42_9PSEU|nr:antibiotic biosynthesis monooxygenase [Amycolatopsis sacchari]SFK69981.1 Quinol monooxygenase YgiN [Amycolatopsis sacchari]